MLCVSHSHPSARQPMHACVHPFCEHIRPADAWGLIWNGALHVISPDIEAIRAIVIFCLLIQLIVLINQSVIRVPTPTALWLYQRMSWIFLQKNHSDFVIFAIIFPQQCISITFYPKLSLPTAIISPHPYYWLKRWWTGSKTVRSSSSHPPVPWLTSQKS